MKEQRIPAKQRANKTALVCYGVMNFILIACYLLEVVVRVIENVISNTKLQNDAANNTAKGFDAISKKIDAVYDQTERTMRLMKELERANAAISQGIETISAATQEVTAHSNETLSISNENTKVTGEVGVIISKLHEMAQELSGMK